MERKKIKPLTQTQKDFLLIGHPITSSSKMMKEKHFTQHRGTSVYEHSIGVAYTSYFIAKHLPVQFDEKALIRGALLHDYFLYDWHEKDDSHKWHGFNHPRIAKEKAIQDFQINEKEANIIHRHMFPLTLIPPKHREGVLVSCMDKICAICEMMNIRYLSKSMRLELNLDCE